MTQPIGSVAYQAGAQIAADKSASLVWLECEASQPGSRISALSRLDFSRIVHQRKADWPATAVEAAVIRLLCYLWEDVRAAEKLETTEVMCAHSLELFLADARGGRVSWSQPVPSFEAGR